MSNFKVRLTLSLQQKQELVGLNWLSLCGEREKSKGNWGSSIVDMVFVTEDLKTINAYQPKVDVSDHLPLVVEIKV